MKKVLSLLVAAALVTVATSAMAAPITVANTKHDLSQTGGAGGYNANNTNQVCVFCHTPHNAVKNRALWNRNAAITTFSLYTSGANIEANSWYVGGSKTTLPAASPSMLCLGCHDGSTTMNNISRPPAGVVPSNNVAITSVGTNLGSDLTNDHPISFNYIATQTAIPATLVAATADGNGMSVVNPLTNLKYPLANAVSIECNTCHNVHDNTTFKPFLRDTMAKSALCTGCHIK